MKPLSIEDARQPLSAHVAAKGLEIREKYGPHIGWHQLLQILADRGCVRYPCEIAFDTGPLQPDEFAYPAPKGARPEDGFIIHIHPFFASQPDRIPYLVLYQLVVVNYGGFAASEDAETFGAAALGLSKDQYYQILCEMADAITENRQT